MLEKSELQKALEGFSLIVIGVFVLFFEVLSLLPESEFVLFANVTVFDLVQTILRIAVTVVIGIYYEVIRRQVTQFYSLHFQVYADTKSDFNLFGAFLKFSLLVFVYELLVPGLKDFTAKIDRAFAMPVFLCLDFLFILAGLFLLVKTWKAYQHFVADVARERLGATSEVPEDPPADQDPL